MWAICWNSLKNGKLMTGHTRYATEYEAAQNANFCDWYYAQRGFEIKHWVVRVDEPAASETKEQTA